MFAGHRAAHGHAGFQNIGTKQLAAAQLVGVVGVKHDEGVQVAVPRMKHIQATQLVLALHF